MKRYALISGVAYFLIFATGFYANFIVLESLVDWDNMANTTQNFVQFHSNLGLGLLVFLAMLFFDVVLVFTLFPLTQSAHRKLTYVASSLRMLHAIGFAIGLFGLYKIYRTTTNVKYQGIEGLEWTIQQALHHFDTVWTIALVLFGIHLFLLGYLSIRYSAFPKLIGLFLVVAASGYVVESGAKLFLPSYFDYRHLFEYIVIFTGVLGEFTLTFWLLVKGFLGFKRKEA
jgi:hypothetical protein